jgi:hypothetical protein
MPPIVPAEQGQQAMPLRAGPSHTVGLAALIVLAVV